MGSHRGRAVTATGELIRQARKGSGLSQRELARRAGINQATLAAYELGTRDPSLSKVLRVSRGLGVPGWSLLPPEERPADTEAGRAGSALARITRLAAEARKGGLTEAGVIVMAELAAADLRAALSSTEGE